MGRSRTGCTRSTRAGRPSPEPAAGRGPRVGPDRDRARHLVADVALRVGVHEVLGRSPVRAERAAELGEVRGPVDVEEGGHHAVRLGERRPAQGQQGVRVLEAVVHVVEDRAVTGGSDGQHDIVRPGHLDGLGAYGERLGALRGQVPGRIGRIDLLHDEVLDVGVDVGHAPGDVIVVAEDHARRARE